jgi:hypothetical protein
MTGCSPRDVIRRVIDVYEFKMHLSAGVKAIEMLNPEHITGRPRISTIVQRSAIPVPPVAGVPTVIGTKRKLQFNSV